MPRGIKNSRSEPACEFVLRSIHTYDTHSGVECKYSGLGVLFGVTCTFRKDQLKLSQIFKYQVDLGFVMRAACGLVMILTVTAMAGDQHASAIEIVILSTVLVMYFLLLAWVRRVTEPGWRRKDHRRVLR
jgi:uncharacterized membrane protein